MACLFPAGQAPERTSDSDSLDMAMDPNPHEWLRAWLMLTVGASKSVSHQWKEMSCPRRINDVFFDISCSPNMFGAFSGCKLFFEHTRQVYESMLIRDQSLGTACSIAQMCWGHIHLVVKFWKTWTVYFWSWHVPSFRWLFLFWLSSTWRCSTKGILTAIDSNDEINSKSL